MALFFILFRYGRLFSFLVQSSSLTTNKWAIVIQKWGLVDFHTTGGEVEEEMSFASLESALLSEEFVAWWPNIVFLSLPLLLLFLLAEGKKEKKSRNRFVASRLERGLPVAQLSSSPAVPYLSSLQSWSAPSTTWRIQCLSHLSFSFLFFLL